MNSLDYQPRRPAPWKLPDVVLLLIVYWLLPLGLLRTAETCFHVTVAKPAADAPKETGHPLSRILTERHNSEGVWPFVVGVVMAIVVAPVAEELLFRLLLQGWLESAMRRLRRQLHWSRRFCDATPIILSSLAFAAIHYRAASPRQELSTLVLFLNIQTAVNILMVVAILGWLRLAVKAGPADLGFDIHSLRDDIAIGLTAAPIVIMLTLALRLSAGLVCPELIKYPWSDPFFLLPLAFTLGFLYYRTHRIVPSIVLHATFNAILGVFMAILTMLCKN